MSDTRYSTVGGEVCRECGRRFKMVWSAPDDVWERVVGDEDGSLCPDCFDRLAAFKNVPIRWLCMGTDQ